MMSGLLIKQMFFYCKAIINGTIRTLKFNRNELSKVERNESSELFRINNNISKFRCEKK